LINNKEGEVMSRYFLTVVVILMFLLVNVCVSQTHWNKYVENPILETGLWGSCEDKFVISPWVLYDGITYHIWYSGYDGPYGRIGYANSPDGVNWTKYEHNPVFCKLQFTDCKSTGDNWSSEKNHFVYYLKKLQ
jgi:hypothetical protein